MISLENAIDLRWLRALLALLFVLAAAAPGTAVPATAVAAALTLPAPAPIADLQAFQLVTPGAGWVLAGQRLYWTDDDGANWRDMTPPLAGAETHIAAASFSDAAHGWAVTLAGDLTAPPGYALA